MAIASRLIIVPATAREGEAREFGICGLVCVVIMAKIPPDTAVRCSHVLIKHAESRNPISRRTNTPLITEKSVEGLFLRARGRVRNVLDTPIFY